MIRKYTWVLAIALLCITGTVAAQNSTPESAAQAYFNAMTGGERETMSKLMHPEALASFRSMLQPLVKLAEPKHESAMLEMFQGVTSVAQLHKLNDVEFYSSFYAGMTTLQPELGEALRGAETELFGHVMEGTDTAHVVYRMTMQMGPTVAQTAVISLRRFNNSWAVLLTGEIEGFAESIRQTIEQDPASYSE